MGYKGLPFRLFTHARMRALERGLSVREIKLVLAAPDAESPSRAHPGRRVLRKILSRRRRVCVVIIPPRRGDREVAVVTVWVDE
jgi:hypothetical protein